MQPGLRQQQSTLRLRVASSNLRQEKNKIQDDLLNYKTTINQQTEETQQTVEDYIIENVIFYICNIF